MVVRESSHALSYEDQSITCQIARIHHARTRFTPLIMSARGVSSSDETYSWDVACASARSPSMSLISRYFGLPSTDRDPICANHSSSKRGAARQPHLAKSVDEKSGKALKGSRKLPQIGWIPILKAAVIRYPAVASNAYRPLRPVSSLMLFDIHVSVTRPMGRSDGLLDVRIEPTASCMAWSVEREEVEHRCIRLGNPFPRE